MANRNNPFAGVDMDIVNNALPPDVKANLQQLQGNLDQAVKDVVTDFGKTMQSQLEALCQSGAVQLQQQLDTIFAQQINPIDQEIKTLQQTITAMIAGAAGNPALLASLTVMDNHATNLNQTLNDAKAKVATFGSTIGAGANQLLKKAIPFPL